MVFQSIRLVEITKEVNTDKGIKRLSLRRTLKIKWRRIWVGTWVGNHERVREVKESLMEKRVTDSKLRIDRKVYQQDEWGSGGP